MQVAVAAARRGSAVPVGIYAGMEASELAAVLRLALQLPPSATFSAFVLSEAPRTGAGKKLRRRQQVNWELVNGAGGGKRRVVPLSLACRSPELLRGVNCAFIFLFGGLMLGLNECDF